MQDPTPSKSPAHRRIIRLRAVHRLEAADLFPRRPHLGTRAAGWYGHEIAVWVDSRRRAEVST